MSGSPSAISLEQVCKRYSSRPAVSSLELEVAPGELVAVVGPNGAGKTTAIEMMEGYRRPDSGRVLVLGLDPFRDSRRLRPLMGLMLQEGGIYPTIRVGEAARLFAGYYANPEAPGPLLERVGLSSFTSSRYRQLSGGEKQRLSLALALIGRPQVLFLDEPTAGMDPRARLLTWEVVKEQQKAGVTIVLTTHSMEEAERLADRVAILKDGLLVAFETPDSLRASTAQDLLHLELPAPLPEALLGRLRALPAVGSVIERGGGRYELHTKEPSRIAAELTAMLAEQRLTFDQLRSGRSSLEEVFLALTEEIIK